MSYAFNVRKVDGTLVLENVEYAAKHIPDGAVFSIGGHEPTDESPTGNLSVGLSVAEGGPYNTHRATTSVAFSATRTSKEA